MRLTNASQEKLLTGMIGASVVNGLNTYLYKAGVQQFNGGLSAAIGVMVLIIAVMLSLIQLAFNKRANN